MRTRQWLKPRCSASTTTSTANGWSRSSSSNDGAAATTDDLKAHVRENLANYKVPRAITVLDELPRGSTGKIVRRELQALVEPT